MKKLAMTIALATLSTAAMAHPGHPGDPLEHVGFLGGLMHPVSGLDHVAAMVAVGLWAASFKGKERVAIPAAFVGMMTLGFIFGANGVQIPMMEQGIAASVLVIGLLAAWAKRIPAVAAMVIVGVFALFHGVAHGSEMQGGAFQFGLGFIISTIALHVAGYFMGTALNKNVWATRVAGTIIGAVGLGLMFA